MALSTGGEGEVLYEVSPFIRAYKDGRLERLTGTEITPPFSDPRTGVSCKDVVFAQETNLSARIYMPRIDKPDTKLPLLVYFHGGAFIVNTPFSAVYQDFLCSLVAEANLIIFSPDYRKAPEHPLPTAYEDCWAAVKWVASHSGSEHVGQEEWLRNYADFGRVFLGGDSAGGNIAHNLGIRAGFEKIGGLKFDGLVLVHPFFWVNDPVAGETTDPEMRAKIGGYWLFACPESVGGCDDPRLNPVFEPRLSSLVFKRVIIFVAEHDVLKHRGWLYYKTLIKSGWGGKAVVLETEAEKHIFHLNKSNSPGAADMIKHIVSFIN